jgi:hypothetical protein
MPKCLKTKFQASRALADGCHHLWADVAQEHEAKRSLLNFYDCPGSAMICRQQRLADAVTVQRSGYIGHHRPLERLDAMGAAFVNAISANFSI